MGLIIILFPDALLLFTLENSFNHYNNRCIYLRALWGGYPISPPSLCLLQIIRILHRTYLSLSLLGKFQAYHLYLYPYKIVCDSFAYFFVFKLCLFLNFMSPRPTMLVHSHWGGGVSFFTAV